MILFRKNFRIATRVVRIFFQLRMTAIFARQQAVERRFDFFFPSS